jgi:hypothetical protein
MLTIGAGELRVPLGDTVDCPHCGQQHPIKYGNTVMEDGTLKPSKLLAYYKCGDQPYIAGINGLALNPAHLLKENAELRAALYDEHSGISFSLRDAELQRLQVIEAAAKNLVAQKGRHNTEVAFLRLTEVLTPASGLSIILRRNE